MSLIVDRPRARPGVTPTRVQAASIDRLERTPDAPHRAARLQPGDVDPLPTARSRTATLHIAVDTAGREALVLRGTAAVIAARADDLRYLGCLRDPGLAIPAVRAHVDGELWLGRWPTTSQPPAPDVVGRYVAAAVQVALHDGTVIGTGEPCLLADGHIGSVDVTVARQLEFDERVGLGSLWCSLVLLDAVGAADAAARLCGSRPTGLPAAAERAVVSLAAEWTPASLGLSLHHVACATVAAGPRSEPLVLLADELLHRLDLAHHLHSAVDQLASPTRAQHLLDREAAWT